MTRKVKVMGGILLFVVLAVGLLACSADGAFGSTSQAIGENACGYRAVPTTQSTTGQGVALPSYTLECGGTYQDSVNGQYGYTNCTNAMIWEVTELDGNGVCGDRVINTYVAPATNPSDQTDCNATNMKYWVYGLDTVNSNFYNWASGTSPAANVNCSWSSLFGCDCNSQVSNIDLDNFPDGNGGYVTVQGVRIVGQIYNSSQGAYETIRENIGMYDYGTCCTMRPE